eukprot:4730536-Pleurochrysis_carterae.AAC.2
MILNVASHGALTGGRLIADHVCVLVDGAGTRKSSAFGRFEGGDRSELSPKTSWLGLSTRDPTAATQRS